MYIYLVNIGLSLIVYFALFYFFPTKGGKKLMSEINDVNLYRTKELVIKDESYYG